MTFYQINQYLYSNIIKNTNLPQTKYEWINFLQLVLSHKPIDTICFDKQLKPIVKIIQQINNQYLFNIDIEDSIWQSFFIAQRFHIKSIVYIFKQLNYIPFNVNFSEYNYRHYLLSHFDLCIDPSIYCKLFLNKLDKFKITFCSINTLLFTNMIDICIDNYHVQNIRALQEKISTMYTIDLLDSYLRLLAITHKQYERYNDFIVHILSNNYINDEIYEQINSYCKFTKSQREKIKPYIFLRKL